MASLGLLEGTCFNTRDPISCEIVRSGAHDGHAPVGATPQRPAATGRVMTQMESWFSPNSGYDSRGLPLLGQIFFGLDDRAIDSSTDRKVLDDMAKYLADFRLNRLPGVELWFCGYADPSGAAQYNTTLSQKRAKGVAAYVDGALRRLPNRTRAGLFYRATTYGFGEVDSTGDKYADRRVDILDATNGGKDPSHSQTFEPFIVKSAPGEAWASGTLQFRTHASISLELGVGFAVVYTEVRNPKTGYSVFYQFTGFEVGPGLPVGFSSEDEYDDYTFPPGLINVDDFEGPGTITSAGFGYGVSLMTFNGVDTRFLKLIGQANQSGFNYINTGLGFDFGISFATGAWMKIPGVRTAEQLWEWIGDREEKPGRPKPKKR
ncbi:hypothetical protein sos41_32360 [Alphaproteobacteria bacterium SO-S41]|nr:hypothetical protein sos41_32360 [Alphaproteobacteria bacterium SO-S41]